MSKGYLRLKVYKGETILKDESGKVVTENQEIVLENNGTQFERTLRNIPSIGFGRAEIIDYLDGNKKPIEVPEDVQAVFDEVFIKRKKEVAEDPKDVQIAELMKRLEALESAKSLQTETPEPKPATVKTLKELREEYKKLSGVDAPKAIGEEELQNAINELLNKEIN